MILNKKQLSITSKSIENLQKSIDTLNLSKNILDFWQVRTWESRIADLEEEIKEFQYLESASELNFTKENLQKAIIHLRIASGMTQKELAEAIRIQEQQIQRYEQDHYRTASFERIVQILRALSKDIQLKIVLKKAKKISLFSPLMQDPNVSRMMRTVQERGALLEIA